MENHRNDGYTNECMDTPENLARLFNLYPGIEFGWDLSDPEKCPKTHWFLSSERGWNSGTDLIKEISIRRREDRDSGIFVIGSAALYLVPGEADQQYHLNQGTPQVEGAVFISRLHWPKRRK
jgi:hypothetical protein